MYECRWAEHSPRCAPRWAERKEHTPVLSSSTDISFGHLPPKFTAFCQRNGTNRASTLATSRRSSRSKWRPCVLRSVVVCCAALKSFCCPHIGLPIPEFVLPERVFGSRGERFVGVDTEPYMAERWLWSPRHQSFPDHRSAEARTVSKNIGIGNPNLFFQVGAVIFSVSNVDRMTSRLR
jgi:hypothetical protein